MTTSAVPETALVRTEKVAPPAVTETSGTAVAAQARAAVEARYTVALNRPRNIGDVRVRLLEACKRPQFAEAARYSKPVGGKSIVGFSVRFAEEAIRAMTNILVETMMIFDDDMRRIVRVSVTDLEANVSYPTDVTVEKTVERRRTRTGDEVLSSRENSSGDVVYRIRATEDDLLNKQNALISKALRNGALRLMPADLLEEAEQVAIETMRNRDRKDPQEAIKRVSDAFHERGVSPSDLETFLGHDLKQINESELALLRTAFNALREGEATWAEIMESAGKTSSDTVATKTKANLESLKKRLDETPEAAEDDEEFPPE